jgi:hypothetical protein
MEQDVRPKLAVNTWCPRCQRRSWIGYRWQIIIFDSYPLRRLLCGFFRLSRDQRDLIALKAHFLVTEYRLVRIYEAVGISWHISGGEHRDDAWIGQRGARIEGTDAGVRAVRKDNLEMKHRRPNEVGGIQRGTGYFVGSIRARERSAERGRHAVSPTMRMASTILR